ncbi:MAG: Response regulator receiver [Gammaproteobacteria bacterium]|jgi:CheY-like chemotaxis protein|nr:Response regulator receiver [Gammaproteobacteria bacterium]
MHINQIPYCFHPSTIILVDDDVHFLKSLSLQLSSHGNCLAYHNPYEALDFLRTYKNTPFTDRCVSLSSSVTQDEPEIRIDLKKIYKEVFNPTRFSEVSIALVDYSMPGMNGVEFCRQIKNRKIKKIMLTGEADAAIAVQAFNEGIIDKFIMKGSPNMIQEVNKAIHEMQIKYYLDLSKLLTIALENNHSSPPFFLLDPLFSEFFYKIIAENKIAEFYLLENSGNFLLLDAKGNVSWLVVCDEMQMKFLYEFAKNEHAQEPVEDSENIVKSIAKRERIPFFFLERNYDIPVYEWGPYLHPATEVLSENGKYYYALIKGQSVYPIEDQEKILPFTKYDPKK